MKIVGIDIGTYSIKLAEIESSANTQKLIKVLEYPFNLDPANDNKINIVSFLREIVEKYDNSLTKFVLAIPQDKISVKYKLFPFKEKQKILKSLPFELEDDIPFDQQDVIYESKFIMYKNNQSHVLACACPKNHIQDKVSLVQEVNMDLSILTAEAFALANLFEDWQSNIPVIDSADSLEDSDEKDRSLAEAKALLHIGHIHSILIIIENKKIIAQRTFLWGGDNLIKGLLKLYKMPYQEIAKEIKSKAFILLNNEGATEEQITFSDTLKKVINKFANEIKLNLIEIKSEFNIEVKEIEFSGGVGNLKNLTPFLTQLLEVACNNSKYFNSLPKIENLVNTNDKNKWAVSIGLAIEGLKKPKNPPVNFLKQEFSLQSKFWQFFLQRWSYLIRAASILFLLLFFYSLFREKFSYNLLNDTDLVLKEQGKRIANLSPTKLTTSNISRYVKDKNEQLEEYYSLIDLFEMNSALDILKKFTNSLSILDNNQIEINLFNISDDMLSVQGIVDKNKISLLKRTLNNMSIDKKVKEKKIESKDEVNKKIANKIYFSFEIRVDRNLKKGISKKNNTN